MTKFEKILNDRDILNIYEKIVKDENKNEWWAYHGIEHVLAVSELTEKILRLLKYKEDFIEETKISAILHDIGCINGKKNHSINSYKFAKKYIEDNEIKLINKEDVLEAIKIHSDGFQTNNIMASVLILCDKLDIKNNRLTKKGEGIEGIRQWKYIKDIKINLRDNKLEIKIICSKELNKKELENFYFTEKLINAIKCFKRNMNIDCNIYLNEDIWKI